VETSVIGRECEIGRGCVVRDSYIGDRVTVHDGAMVVGALVLEGAVIHAGAKLLPGCIVSYKVDISECWWHEMVIQWHETQGKHPQVAVCQRQISYETAAMRRAPSWACRPA